MSEINVYQYCSACGDELPEYVQAFYESLDRMQLRDGVLCPDCCEEMVDMDEMTDTIVDEAQRLP